MVGGIFIAGFLCIVAMIIMWLTAPDVQGNMPWPVIMAIPLVGLPIGMLCMLALLAVNWTRKARANREVR